MKWFAVSAAIVATAYLERRGKSDCAKAVLIFGALIAVFAA
jgi:hypothetical protein